MRPIVYISSPYTKGDVEKNVRFQHQVFYELFSTEKFIPIAPLLSHYQHAVFPMTYEQWIDYDLQILAMCDCVLRLDAVGDDGYFQSESQGAHIEVRTARLGGIPVYYSIQELMEGESN